MSLFPEDQPYRVLARKYRPSGFDALIGQEAVVTTLSNAISRNRLAQAWLLTGVRGVGKTSTARLIAKALNCLGEDGKGGPTIDPCGVCANCTAIAGGQHIDVIEIDAASNTGVDNIREIIEAVRYATVSARYKIYIIDEVHMLSKGAFNALLKTLEEPPAHVKFIFATTEVNKVPPTILSRCQRFDLKRVPVELLQAHFRKVSDLEAAPAEDEALALIARAAEGSVRDGLSILDQAIAQAGAGTVTADLVRDMLGLADRGRLTGLLEAILEGNAANALSALDSSYSAGVDPQSLLTGLLDLVHSVSRAKLAGAADPALGEGDKAAILDWAQKLTFPTLHRLWQLLLKGHADVAAAPAPQQAADMAVLRCVHAANMPDPGEVARKLAEGLSFTASAPAASRIAPRGTIPTASAPSGPELYTGPIQSSEDLVALFEMRVEPHLAKNLYDDLAFVSAEEGKLVLAQLGPMTGGVANNIARCLKEWTGRPWEVSFIPAREGVYSLHQIAEKRQAALREAALEHPMVKALMEEFTGAELIQPVASNSVAGRLRSATA